MNDVRRSTLQATGGRKLRPRPDGDTRGAQPGPPGSSGSSPDAAPQRGHIARLFVDEGAERPDVKFHLVEHSMGEICRVWEDWPRVRRAITWVEQSATGRAV